MAKVLIVEDDATIRAAYSFALNRAGYQALEAAEGAQALAALEEQKPEIVLLDMLMPGMSGLDFLRESQVAQRYPEIKIIALSNIDTPRVVEQAKELGAAEYLIKVNMTPHEMVDLVRRYVGEPA